MSVVRVGQKEQKKKRRKKDHAMEAKEFSQLASAFLRDWFESRNHNLSA